MTTTSTTGRQRTAPRLVALVMRGVVVVMLAIDAVAHLRLAPGYQQSAPGGIGAGNLFRIEAAAALVVAAWVLWRGSRPALLAALGVGLSAVIAVVLYRYVDLPALGPLPAMYEPVWFFEKSLSAVAEALAAMAALVALTAAPGRRPTSPQGASGQDRR
ncbi:MAG: hypothetical protein ABIO48_05885 [Pedococcus sp.]